MPKILAVTLIAVTLAVTACRTGTPPPPEIPIRVPERTLSPRTPTPTPSQAELSAEAERVYRGFFDERRRLELLGGADEPTPALIEYGGGQYLRQVTALLRHQKESGVSAEGASEARVVPAPGETQPGMDPRFTLRVCEDHSNSTYTEDGVTHPAALIEGLVYFGHENGRLKVLAGNLEIVESCTF